MTTPEAPEQRNGQKQEKRYERTRYQILLFAAVIAIFALVLGVVLDWYIDPQTSAQKKDLVQALGLITAGVAGTVGIFFTWRGQRLAQESLEDTRRNTEEELRLTREGQITERFTRAIDQLGATSDGGKSVEVRLGAIYALERISKESKEDYWPIMEILTAYVRQHAPRRSPPDEGGQGVAEEAHEEDSTGKQAGGDASPLALDIQTIMAVLRRRTGAYGNGEPEPIDLRETDLSRAFLRQVNLAESTLWGTKLSKAFLRQATLTKAYLFEAALTKADLVGTKLSEAVLWKADLSGANLSEADLSGANLTWANLSKADLSKANLSGAKLLRTTGLTQGQLHQAIGDETTQLPPPSRTPTFGPRSWPIK